MTGRSEITEGSKRGGCGGEVSGYPGFWEHLLYWSIVVGGVFLDLWSKHAVFAWLSGREEGWYSVIDGFLRLVIAENDGAAFGLASGQRWFLLTVSFGALIAVPMIFVFGRIQHRVMQISLGLITAGVVGNLYDRLFNEGRVRDFIDVYRGRWHWPAFNVADSLLCIGVGLIIIGILTYPSCQKPADGQK